MATAAAPSRHSGFPSNHPKVEDVYDLGQQLGRGSFSTVYVGVHRMTGEKVALKVIPSKNYRHNERAKQLLRTEVAVMSRIRKLHHPNLMSFKHTFEDAEKIVMVLEILSGGELFDRIVKKGHYSERDASQLTSVIVKALGALHSVGILHRDLKPENCIYSTPADDSPLKITDFGLAALLAPDADTDRLVDRHLVGTPGYIAPEILTNYEYSPASDLWAAGVILFILLSGSPPFYGRTHKDIFEKIKAGHWGFLGRNWAQVSDGAKDLVRKMLRPSPAERLTLPEILDHPWIREHDSLPEQHLPDTLESLAKLNARQRFRAAAMVCIGSSRLQRVLGGMVGGSSGSGEKEKGAEKAVEEAEEEELDLSAAFTAEELERLKAEFGKATEGEGEAGQRTCLRLPQFKGVMAKLGLEHLPVEHMFRAFDLDGTGDVDYREFLLGVSKFRLKGPEAIKFYFTVFDGDNNGSISREELTKVLVHNRRCSQLFGNHVRKSTASDASVASPAGAGPVVVVSDDGETAQLVPAAAAGEGGKPALCERTEPRYMEMDPDAYEVAESIAELFESLDTDHDNQVTLEEFLAGVERHPELLSVFHLGSLGEKDGGGPKKGGGQGQQHGALRGAVPG